MSNYVLVHREMNDEHLEHHGVVGMHWGIRRYQNADGTLTETGKKRYGGKNPKDYYDKSDKYEKKRHRASVVFNTSLASSFVSPLPAATIAAMLGGPVGATFVGAMVGSTLVATGAMFARDTFDKKSAKNASIGKMIEDDNAKRKS